MKPLTTSAVVLTAAIVAGCGGPQGPVPSLSAPAVATHVVGLPTTFCVGINTDTNEFPAPTTKDVNALRSMHITCVRTPLGNTASENAAALANTRLWNAQGFRVLGIASSPTVGTPINQATISAAALAVSKIAPVLTWLETGNELNVGDTTSVHMTAAQATQFQIAVANAAHAANPNILVSSAGTSGYDTNWLTNTSGSFAAVDYIGVHLYGVADASFGAALQNVQAEFGKPAAMTECMFNTPQDLQADMNTSNGHTPLFVFQNLAILELNPSMMQTLGAHS